MFDLSAVSVAMAVADSIAGRTRPAQAQRHSDPYSDAISAICAIQGGMGAIYAAGMLSPHAEVAGMCLKGWVESAAKTPLMIAEINAMRTNAGDEG